MPGSRKKANGEWRKAHIDKQGTNANTRRRFSQVCEKNEKRRQDTISANGRRVAGQGPDVDVRNGREMVAGLTAKRKESILKVELIIPIDSLTGKLRQDGFYFRKYRGQQIVQKCLDRSKHVKTEAEAANQRRFAAKYAGKRKREMASRTTDDVNRHDMPDNEQNKIRKGKQQWQRFFLVLS